MTAAAMTFRTRPCPHCPAGTVSGRQQSCPECRRLRKAERNRQAYALRAVAAEDHSAYAVVYETVSRYSGVLPQVHGQYADESRARAVAEELCRRLRTPVRVERWSNGPASSGYDRAGEELVALYEVSPASEPGQGPRRESGSSAVKSA